MRAISKFGIFLLMLFAMSTVHAQSDNGSIRFADIDVTSDKYGTTVSMHIVGGDVKGIVDIQAGVIVGGKNVHGKTSTVKANGGSRWIFVNLPGVDTRKSEGAVEVWITGTYKLKRNGKKVKFSKRELAG